MASDFRIIDDESDEPPPRGDENRLNLTRIRAITLERRAAHRRLLWARAAVFAFACLAVITGVDALRVQGARRMWFGAASLVFLLLAARAALRLRQFALPVPSMDEPRPDPDAFSSLSDGRQFAGGLDELSGGHSEPTRPSQ